MVSSVNVVPSVGVVSSVDFSAICRCVVLYTDCGAISRCVVPSVD